MKSQNDLKYNKFRILDIDDLIILKLMGEGYRYCHITKILGVTPPAISHRIKKYMQIWEGFWVKNPASPKQQRLMSPQCKEVCKMAAQMLEALNEVDIFNVSDPVGDELRIAS